LRVALFAGFRPGEETLGIRLAEWLLDLSHRDDLPGFEFFAYPLSDPPAVFPGGKKPGKHLLAGVGVHRRRPSLRLVERELAIKEFHLVIAFVRGDAPEWRAVVAGPGWFEEVVATGVRSARSAEGTENSLPYTVAESPLAGFARRLEGRRIQPLEVIFEVPQGSEGAPALSEALRPLLEAYAAAWAGRSGI